jgi:hypothetical protein
MATRFTEAAKQAALADLKNGMTLAKAAVKRVNTKVVHTASMPLTYTGRVLELENENKQLKDENHALRSLMLDGYIAKERHSKLRLIAQTLRDSGKNQLERIMEIILVADAETPASSSVRQP